VRGAAGRDQEVHRAAPVRLLDDRAGITSRHLREGVGDLATGVAVHAYGVELDARLAELDAGDGDPVRDE
jgi:hypothetical protein